jgi:hypothetical protein
VAKPSPVRNLSLMRNLSLVRNLSSVPKLVATTVRDKKMPRQKIRGRVLAAQLGGRIFAQSPRTKSHRHRIAASPPLDLARPHLDLALIVR